MKNLFLVITLGGLLSGGTIALAQDVNKLMEAVDTDKAVESVDTKQMTQAVACGEVWRGFWDEWLVAWRVCS
jgi:hypothetical protein